METAANPVVEEEGIAAVVGFDLARARDEAVRDALQKAVIHVVEAWLEPLDGEKKSAVLREEIYDRAEGFIQDYRVLFDLSDTDIYSVTVRATVFAESITNELRRLGLIKQASFPNFVTRISLTITGIRSYNDYVRCRGIVRERLSGIREAALREVSWGSARFDIAAEGPIQHLAEQIRDKLMAEIKRQDERELVVNLR